MLIVDASCLVEIVTRAEGASAVRKRLAEDTEQAAPHLVDVEVLSGVRRLLAAGELEETAADRAIQDLLQWPGERVPHGPLVERAWELRENVRVTDGMYVALAEMLDAVLLTGDHRLARATGPRCDIAYIAVGD